MIGTVMVPELVAAECAAPLAVPMEGQILRRTRRMAKMKMEMEMEMKVLWARIGHRPGCRRTSTSSRSDRELWMP